MKIKIKIIFLSLVHFILYYMNTLIKLITIKDNIEGNYIF